MVNGIVRFCRPDNNSYLVTVSTQDVPDETFDIRYFRDPGSLAIDDFLTEEEEAKILESLQDAPRSVLGLSAVLGSVRAVLFPTRSLQAAGRQLLFPFPAV